MQRARVGLIGLFAVMVLIGLAGLLMSSVRDRSAAPNAAGGNVALAAGIAGSESADGNAQSEPLADLGVAPGAASVDAPGNAN